MSDEKTFKTWIVWGEIPEEGDKPYEYAFATQAELDAFIEGIEAAEGWMGYTFCDGPNYVVDDCNEVVEAKAWEWQQKTNELLEKTYGINLADTGIEGERLEAFYTDDPQEFVDWIGEKRGLIRLGDFPL